MKVWRVEECSQSEIFSLFRSVSCRVETNKAGMTFTDDEDDDASGYMKDGWADGSVEEYDDDANAQIFQRNHFLSIMPILWCGY